MDETTKTRKVIGSRLALARERAGLSQAQVATKLKLPRPSISEIEAGRRRVAVDEMIKFADLYQVDMNWLSGQGVQHVNEVRDKLQLAARNLASLKSDDLEKVIDLLTSLKPKDKK